MIKLKRTDSDNKDFILLVKLLDADLQKRDGEDHTFFAQYNKIINIKHAIVAYDDQNPVGCGAIKDYTEGLAEVKRMYVKPECRRKGIARLVLEELENWAKELGYQSLILETGNAQPEAINLYKSSGYEVIPNFGQYENVESSVCFKKELH